MMATCNLEVKSETASVQRVRTSKCWYIYLCRSSKNFARAPQFARSSAGGNSYHSWSPLQTYFFMSENKLFTRIFIYHYPGTKGRLIPPASPWAPLGETLSLHKCLPKSEAIPEEAREGHQYDDKTLPVGRGASPLCNFCALLAMSPSTEILADSC